MENWWEIISGYFKISTFILLFIGWIIWQFLWIWWKINKWILIGGILLLILTLYLGCK